MGAWNYTKVPTWLRGGLVPPMPRVVYEVLLDHRNTRTGEAWPSLETISAEAAVSRRSVANTLAWLRDHGLVVWKKRTDRKGQTTSLYTPWADLDAPPAELSECTSCTHHSAPRAPTPVHEVHTNKNHGNDTQGNENHERPAPRDDEQPAADGSDLDVLEYQPGGRESGPPATPKQVGMLTDLHLLGGGKVGEISFPFSVDQADHAIKEATAFLNEPGNWHPPASGTPEYDRLSANGRQKIGQRARWPEATHEEVADARR